MASRVVVSNGIVRPKLPIGQKDDVKSGRRVCQLQGATLSARNPRPSAKVGSCFTKSDGDDNDGFSMNSLAMRKRRQDRRQNVCSLVKLCVVLMNELLVQSVAQLWSAGRCGSCHD